MTKLRLFRWRFAQGQCLNQVPGMVLGAGNTQLWFLSSWKLQSNREDIPKKSKFICKQNNFRIDVGFKENKAGYIKEREEMKLAAGRKEARLLQLESSWTPSLGRWHWTWDLDQEAQVPHERWSIPGRMKSKWKDTVTEAGMSSGGLRYTKKDQGGLNTKESDRESGKVKSQRGGRWWRRVQILILVDGKTLEGHYNGMI